MVNSDRTMTLVQRATEPPGDAMPDWLTIARVAQAMGFDEGFDFRSSEEVFDEIRRFWNPQTGWDVRGVTYERLRRGPVQWPAPPDDDEDRHPIRYLNDGVSQSLHPRGRRDGAAPWRSRLPSRRAQFFARPHLGPARAARRRLPLGAQHRAAAAPVAHDDQDRQGRQAGQAEPAPFVEIHPLDAEAQGISEGDEVEISSRRGRVVLPAVVTDRVRPGNCFAPFHWNDEHGEYLTVNAVTSDAVDQASLQPEFKFAAVSLRRVGPAREASTSAESGMPQPVGARDLLAGVGRSAAPVLTEAESAYVSGFLSALEAAPVAAGVVPVLPAAAPLRDLPRAWFDGVLAGLHSRTAIGSAVAGGTHDEVTVLWGSQTGNAEELAAASVATLTARGIPARALSMVDMSIADLAAVRRAARRDVDLRRRGTARQRGGAVGSPQRRRRARAHGPRLRRLRHRRPQLRRLLRPWPQHRRAPRRTRSDGAPATRRLRTRLRRAGRRLARAGDRHARPDSGAACGRARPSHEAAVHACQSGARRARSRTRS